MEYITTTDLRTKSSQLVDMLSKGGTASLIHRSKIIGVIKPIRESAKPFNAEKFKQLAKKLNLPKTTPRQREALYSKHLMEKYGKGIS